MMACEVLRGAAQYLGSYGDRGLDGQYLRRRRMDLFESLSVAGAKQPNAVITTFYFLRAATGQDNLLKWHASASFEEMRQALAAATDMASTLQ